MIPKSFSASALQTAETCLARYKAESYDKIPSMDNGAAAVGTSVHFALEHFVKAVYIDKTHEWTNDRYLMDLYKIGYMDTFHTAELDTDEFRDGEQLVKKWYMRTDLSINTVVSCEIKEHFMIKTSIGEIPVNFIWDRCDQHSEDVIEVVDYKTIRAYVTAEQLKKKIQPRLYALAAQIKWPNAQRIWVTFDLLRHDSVGVVFTREDNAAMYRYLQRAAERIIATDEDDCPETLNPECKFCVRKSVCETLNRAVAGGTIFALSPSDAAKKKMQVKSQLDALKYLDEELDKILMQEAEATDQISWDVDDVHVEITASKRRQLNSNAAAHILGKDITAKYGTFTLANIDKILKEEPLSPDVREELKQLITVKWGQPSAKVTPASPILEDNE